MHLPLGISAAIAVCFMFCIFVCAAGQTAFVGLHRGSAILFRRKKPSLAEKIFALLNRNAATYVLSMTISLWAFTLLLTAFLLLLFRGLNFSSNINNIAEFLLSLFSIVILIVGAVLISRKFTSATWKIVALPLLVLTALFYPFALIFKFLSNKISVAQSAFLLNSLRPVSLQTVTTSELEKAALTEVDQEIYENAMEFNALRVRDCMTPRTEIVAVEKTEALEIVKQHFINSGHSKLLVYKESIDNVIGYIHLIDMYRKPASLDKILMPITIAPESMQASELLKQLIDKHRSMAVVVDEFGGTSGLVTIEDLIEEIIGDIEDEHDTEDWTERKISDTEFVFSARHEIDYLNETYNLNLPEGDYDTLGGLILYVHQNIPKNRDVVTYSPFEFTILSTAKAKILDVRVKILNPNT